MSIAKYLNKKDKSMPIAKYLNNIRDNLQKTDR